MLLRKCVYPFACINNWKKVNEISLAYKDNFCSYLNTEDITDADFVLLERICGDFQTKNKREYHDLYVQSDCC